MRKAGEKTAEQLVREALEVDSRPTATALSAATGLSRQTIYTLQKSMGFELTDGRATDAVGTVAADLRRRGAVVYRTSNSRVLVRYSSRLYETSVVPIVADVAGDLIRIAVGATRNSPGGRDVVAKVACDGAVNYRAVTKKGEALSRRKK